MSLTTKRKTNNKNRHTNIYICKCSVRDPELSEIDCKVTVLKCVQKDLEQEGFGLWWHEKINEASSQKSSVKEDKFVKSNSFRFLEIDQGQTTN